MLFVAAHETLCEALHVQLSHHRGKTLYLCGNYPTVLPGLVGDQENLRVRRALTAYQILSILEEADESLILFEHDPTLYADNEDLLTLIGELCRQKAAENSSLILFATRGDRWIIRIEPYANRMVFIQAPVGQPKKSRKQTHTTQQSLDMDR